MERVGTVVLVLLVSAIIVVQGVSVLLNWAADDVRLQLGTLNNHPVGRDRTPAGMWLSARLMSDLPATDLQARHARADYFDQLSDRLREMAGASALAGLLIAPLTASGDRATTRRRSDESAAAANTASNGTA
jgi:hypothetical protein